ncbi:MAG: aminotransferase class V-fold PLP-dependent enzyme [Gemmatimonadetes bacterium]|nr:aminotransferase class V-fold PLP-dependent enzyme [Gemmatimonadota bacterium]
MTPLDIDALRADTPATAQRAHLNNAGASLMPDPVWRAITAHLELERGIGGYEAAAESRDAIASVYGEVGRLLGAASDRIAITENATAAFQQALSAIPFREGDVLVTTRNDYVSNQIQYLSLAHRFGIEVERIADGPDGATDLDALEAVVRRRRPRLVAVSHVPTSSGLVQDVAAIGAICRRHDVWFLLDACQSVGQIPLEPAVIGCDFLSATARKFLRGPRGIGFLWVSDRVLAADLEPLFPDLHGADWIAEDLYQPAPGARRFENWEFPYALVLGLGAAVRYAMDVGVEAGGERAGRLAARLRHGLDRVEGVRVLDRGARRCAIVTATVRGWTPEALVDRLREERINTSALDLASGLLDFDDKGVSGALRLSPHYYNTEGEIDRAVEAIARLVG